MGHGGVRGGDWLTWWVTSIPVQRSRALGGKCEHQGQRRACSHFFPVFYAEDKATTHVAL